MELDEIFEKLHVVQCSETVFSKIMYAKTVQELIDIDVGPEELLSYFRAAEELAKMEEEHVIYAKRIIRKMKDACPARRRRAFFI